MLIYFLVGFICIVFLKLNMVALVIGGALLALLLQLISRKRRRLSRRVGPPTMRMNSDGRP